MTRIGLLRGSLVAALVLTADGVVAQPPGGIPGGVLSGPVPVGPGGLPARDNAARKTGTARLRGRVVAADTGEPLRRATVRAMAPDIRESVSTLTDANGLYELKELPAGRYTVTATKGAYASMSYGQTRANEPGRPIELGDNQSVERIDLRLPRGGVIAGTIVDEFGDPVPDAMVVAYRTQFIQGRRRLVPAGRQATADDIGGYRIFGLPPGSYYLSASLRTLQGPLQERSDARSGYAPTYYPGTAELGSAQRVTVRAGQTLSAINLALTPTQTATVSGTVTTANGERPASGFVAAIPRGAASVMLVFMPSLIQPDGRFSVANLAPGEYTLMAQLGPAPGAAAATARASVTVNGQDITGIQLTPTPPATIRGRVTLDGGTVTSPGGALQVMLQPVEIDDYGPGNGASPPAPVRDDLTFELATTATRAALRVTGNSKWAITSIRADGADVTDSLDIAPGTELHDVDVELTSQVPELSGLVTTAGGAPVANYTVVVFAQDRALWTPVTRHVSTGRPDQQGRFRVRSLPPGDYYAVALEYVEPGSWLDPEFLDGLVSAASSVVLNAGETKTVDLKLTEPR